MDALCALWGDDGIDAHVISPARPTVIQGTLADGSPFDLRAFGDRVSLRTWAPGAAWQRTLTDGDGSTRQVPDVATARFHGVVDGWRWGEAADLAAEDLVAALATLLDQRSAGS